MPLPIEPKPIITIGPVMRAWTGQVVIGSVSLRQQSGTRHLAG
jgi:hypothetical protein